MQGCILVQSVLTAMFSFVNVKKKKKSAFCFLWSTLQGMGGGRVGGGGGGGLWLLFTGLLQEEALPLVYCVTVTVLAVEVIPVFTKLALPFFLLIFKLVLFYLPPVLRAFREVTLQ